LITATTVGDGAASAVINIVVLQAENRRFGLVVDHIHDAEEIVVKPLEPVLKASGVFAGATIRGDGRVVLILDVLGIAKQANVMSDVKRRTKISLPALPDVTAQPQTLLLFLTREGRRMAIPLSNVARLEEFPPSALEQVGPRQVIQYRGEILPLMDIDDLIAGKAPLARPAQALGSTIPVVVYNDNQRRVGLMVGRIVDVVEQLLPAAPDGDGPAACVVIQQRVTELIDLQRLVLSAPNGLFLPPMAEAPLPFPADERRVRP